MTGHIDWNALSAEQRADEETYFHQLPQVAPTVQYAEVMNLKAAQTGIVVGNQGNTYQIPGPLTRRIAPAPAAEVAAPVAPEIENPFGVAGRQPGEMYGGVKTYPPEQHPQHQGPQEFDGQEPPPETDEPGGIFGWTPPDLSIPGLSMPQELPGPLKFALPWANPGTYRGEVPKLDLPDVTAPFDKMAGMLPLMLMMMFLKGD